MTPAWRLRAAGEILIRARRARRRGEIEGPSFRELTARDTYAAGLRALIDGALPLSSRSPVPLVARRGLRIGSAGCPC